MNDATILAFDLSSKCTGCTAAILKQQQIQFLKTFSIYPHADTEQCAQELGFLRSKRKVHIGSKDVNCYVKSAQEKISITEKKRRDVLVRNAVNMKLKESLAKSIRKVVSEFQPSLILVERNEAFHGILTTKLLAELRGILDGIIAGIPIIQYSVTEIRKPYPLAEMTRKYVAQLSNPTELAGNKDITKSVIKDFLEKKYRIRCANTDESDSLAVFDTYYTSIQEGDNHETNHC